MSLTEAKGADSRSKAALPPRMQDQEETCVFKEGKLKSHDDGQWRGVWG
jgi:hypothetical protein